jgi:hypothetical protein
MSECRESPEARLAAQKTSRWLANWRLAHGSGQCAAEARTVITAILLIFQAVAAANSHATRISNHLRLLLHCNKKVQKSNNSLMIRNENVTCTLVRCRLRV